MYTVRKSNLKNKVYIEESNFYLRPIYFPVSAGKY